MVSTFIVESGYHGLDKSGGASIKCLARYRQRYALKAGSARPVSAEREHCNGEDRLVVAVLRHEGAATSKLTPASSSVAPSRGTVPPKTDLVDLNDSIRELIYFLIKEMIGLSLLFFDTKVPQ